MAGTAATAHALDAVHADLGVEWTQEAGRAVAGRYGDVGAEYRAIVEGRAFADRAWIDLLELRGADRRRFLHGLVSCDVKGLAAGASAYGFVTSVQGRILAEVVVLAREQSLLIELPAGCGPPIAQHLGKYLIADDVTVEARPELQAVTLFGSEAELELGASELSPGAWKVAPATLFEIPVLADRRPVWGMAALTLWVAPGEAAAFFQRLLEAGRCVGLQPVGLSALEARRVELGVPRFGRDFGAPTAADPGHFPQETGLDAQAVSYTKGCYLGQEVIARIHYRGQVNRVLRGLRLAAGADVAALGDGTEVRLEGRPLGTLSSAVRSPALQAPIALAILHRRGAEPGTRVEVDGAGEAEVTALPFV
ncbi:MAG TPA: glycine cleavage T C-terminal barrel domain-containing protein [Thermoanaerobaculia bacterium]|nr:glycine cleavage T C-terminal barrel domain-containing protein [Thermoanaerobaculia bacterium]